LLFVALAAVRAESKFEFAATPGKLPKEVRPSEYAIRITPDLEKLTFNGSETVKVQVEKLVTQLLLNALELEIASASGGRPRACEKSHRSQPKGGNAHPHLA
jgi:hypothetical protein